jgi:ectoine hydroxylase-related dioxygenase (phytanoyl-CoA dioxygenase family)
MPNLDQEKLTFFEKGYIIFNINDDLLVDKVNSDIDALFQSGDYKTNSTIYSYNHYPRIVESYKFSFHCKSLALHHSILDRLSFFYSLHPVAFSTINFLHSTQQPLHSDYAHFGTLPHRMLVGAWVALEDINPDAGPLQVVPFSHNLKLFDFYDINGHTPKSLHEVKSNYSSYEQYVEDIVIKERLTPITPTLKKGDCVLWEANLLHGSPICVDPSLTRRSQVTHWTFTNVNKHYNPAFSSIKLNRYAERSLTFIDDSQGV